MAGAREPRDRFSRCIRLALSPPGVLVYSFFVEYHFAGALKE